VGITSIAARCTLKLSGGQTQRMRLAPALVYDAAVLLLDEPTIGLDVHAHRTAAPSPRLRRTPPRAIRFLSYGACERLASRQRPTHP
jgi:ABC-type Na+ transport system ATPase subunit NatA